MDTLSFGPSSDTLAISYGQIAHAKDNILVQGDAQTNQIILKANINPGAAGILAFTDTTGSNRLLIPVDGVIAFEIHIVVLEYPNNNNASFFKVMGAAKNIGGTPAIVGTSTLITISEDSPGLHQINPGGTVFPPVLVGGSGSASYIYMEIKNASNTDKAKFVAYVRYTQTLF